MHRHNLQIIGKAAMLSFVMLVILQVAIYAISSASVANANSQNERIYESANSQSLSQVGVAIGTGIGVRFDDETYKQTTVYGEGGKIGETSIESREIRKKLIAENMVIVKEYLALLKTNPLKIMEDSSNRRNTLNTFISQLELRFRNAVISETNIQNQKDLLISDMTIIQNDIEKIKTKINANFSANKAPETVNNVDEYLELRRRYRENFTDVIFINQFLVQYNFLNNYNKNLLDTLINNKEALINESFVVIPDSGDDFLRDFNLLYEEAEFKALNQ